MTFYSIAKNILLTTTIILCFLTNTAFSQALAPQKNTPINDEESLAHHFIQLIVSNDNNVLDNSLSIIKKEWSTELVPFALESIGYTYSPKARKSLAVLLANESNIPIDDLNQWYQWVWNQDFSPNSDYANFKADLYRRIDGRFASYFRDRQNTARIRLDEIRWGGVLQDGIPPLRNPRMITAKKAQYLEDSNIVFGIKINGDARAYPKRILAWHEMFTDTIGGVPIAGVYCTLCGTVIPFRTSVDDVNYTLGTSGFLYRSNKLMYDKTTQSLWSTERGEPVLGPLAGKGIVLPYESVVTTTWGEWKKRHPNTTVLSLNTGHKRDYNEGAAYSDYFATDQLMFNTPFNDNRLANKQEILALRFAASPKEQLAIDTEFLNNNPLYKNTIGRQRFVVFTDNTGANRVYDPGNINFVTYDGEQKAVDDTGKTWIVDEEKLISNDKTRPRLPYHRAFWFGWHAAFPETQLIK